MRTQSHIAAPWAEDFPGAPLPSDTIARLRKAIVFNRPPCQVTLLDRAAFVVEELCRCGVPFTHVLLPDGPAYFLPALARALKAAGFTPVAAYPAGDGEAVLVPCF